MYIYIYTCVYIYIYIDIYIYRERERDVLGVYLLFFSRRPSLVYEQESAGARLGGREKQLIGDEPALTFNGAGLPNTIGLCKHLVGASCDYASGGICHRRESWRPWWQMPTQACRRHLQMRRLGPHDSDQTS